MGLRLGAGRAVVYPLAVGARPDLAVRDVGVPTSPWAARTFTSSQLEAHACAMSGDHQDRARDSGPAAGQVVNHVAVIGTGPWGRRLIRVIDDLGVLSMVCNRGNSEHQAWVRAEYPGARVGQSATEAFEDPSIEAVAIATPIRTHAQMALDALAAGKHCFVEKPLATTAADAWRVVEAADRADRRLAVGYVFLFDPGLDRLHEATADDPVVRAAFSWLKFGTFGEPLVWNLLPHELGLAIWFMGEPDTIEVVGRSSGRDRPRPCPASPGLRGARSGVLDRDRSTELGPNEDRHDHHAIRRGLHLAGRRAIVGSRNRHEHADRGRS